MAKKIPNAGWKITRTWVSDVDLEIICKAWERANGALVDFESAVGALIVGRLAGYDALRVIHGWRTLRKYEKLLDISFKKTLSARTDDSLRVNGIRYVANVKQFWKEIAGGLPAREGAKEVVNG